MAGYEDVQDFVNFPKVHSGKMTYASSGVGTTIHLAGEMFNDAVKVKMVHVPFPGSGPAVTTMLGNQASVMFDDLPSSMPHVKSGALRAIAVTGAKRSPQLPDLPTLKEVGGPYNLGNFEVSAWFALFGPAKLPRRIVNSLNATLVKALNDSEVKTFFAERGTEALPGTREQAATFVNSGLAQHTFAGLAVEALRKGTRAFSHLIRLCGRRDRSHGARGAHIGHKTIRMSA